MELSKLTIVDTKQTQNFTNSEKAQARANIGAVGMEELSKISPMTVLTYADLVATRNGGKLVSGMYYKIKDYATTTAQSDTTAAGHDFSVIVQALDEHTLSENASACMTPSSVDIDTMETITLKALVLGDDYDEGAGHYNFDNDDEVYAYYDKYTIDGFEYYRWMKYSNTHGEWFPVSVNEKPSFALTLTDSFDLSGGYAEFAGRITIDQETGNITDYDNDKVIMEVTEIEVPLILFENKFSPDEGYENAPNVYDMGNIWLYKGTIELDGTTYFKWQKYNNNGVPEENEAGGGGFYMLTTTKNYRNNVGRYTPDGYIYVDSDGGSESKEGTYRAEMILGTNYESLFQESHGGDSYFANCNLGAWELKYCLDNDITRFAWADAINGKGVIYYMKDEWNNECPYDFKNIMFKRKLTNGEYDPASGTDTWVYTFDENGGDDATIMNYSYEYWNFDALPTGIHGNIILPWKEGNDQDTEKEEQGKYWLNDIVFLNILDSTADYKYSCINNKFGWCCHNNTFGSGCYSNILGDQCTNNIFGNGCYGNTFGSYCGGNTFGCNCVQNACGNVATLNILGNHCMENIFGNGCQSNTFGSYCDYNTMNNDCAFIHFGNQTAIDYCRHISIGNGVRFCNIYGTTTPTESKPLQNIKVVQGLSVSPATRLAIAVATGLDYETTVAKNSNGVLKIYCEADLIA